MTPAGTEATSGAGAQILKRSLSKSESSGARHMSRPRTYMSRRRPEARERESGPALNPPPASASKFGPCQEHGGSRGEGERWGAWERPNIRSEVVGLRLSLVGGPQISLS